MDRDEQETVNMNALTKAEPANNVSDLMSVIARAAADPSVDMDKMERLLQMQERIITRQAESEFNQALAAAQTETRTISADAVNPQTRSQYATYAKLDKVLRPIYTRHGFALSFDTADSPKPDHIRVLGHLTHRAGHKHTYQVDMPADGKGAKGGDVMTKTHAAGAAISYGSRYLLKAIFNVAIGEEDRDGNNAETITEAQIVKINEMLEASNIDKPQFLKYLRVERLADIHAANYEAVLAAIRQRNAKAGVRT